MKPETAKKLFIWTMMALYWIVSFIIIFTVTGTGK